MPSGRLGYRSTRPQLVIDNLEVLTKWARSCCPSAIVMVEQVSKTSLSDYFIKTGDLPEGMHLEPEAEKFFIQ